MHDEITLTPSAPTAVDPWHDWQPQWQQKPKSAKPVTPHDRQEKQAPTEPVILRGTDNVSCRRRILDARLWDNLSPALQDAAIEIATAYESLSRGLGFTTSDWQRLPGARNRAAGADQGRLTGSYMDWARACHHHSISHSMVIDVLCYGIACTALDRDRRVRRGATQANLKNGLQLYAQMRGWLRTGYTK